MTDTIHQTNTALVYPANTLHHTKITKMMPEELYFQW